MILLPAIALGIVSLHVVRGSMVEQVEREQLLLLQAMKTSVVDRHVEDMENALRALSREPELPRIFEDEGVRRRILARWELTRSLFPERSYIYFGSRENRIIVSPDWEPPEGYDCTVRPWFQAARHAYGIVWVDPYKEYVTGDLVMSAAMPIYKDGSFRGVLSIDTYLNGFFRLLKQAAGDRTPQVIAVTDRGETLMLNDKESVQFDMAAHPAREDLSQLHNEGRYLTYADTRYYATAVDVPRLRLTLMALRPAELLYGEIRPMVLAIIAITAAFGAVSLVAASYFSRHFIGNIEKLNRYMSAVESGDYRIRNCVSGRDEFRQLNRSLNTMVHHLAQSIRSLEVETNTDALCGIANRRFLTEELQTYVDAHGHRAEDVSIVLLDVDHFKPVNDTYGHAVGDEVLRRVARLMRDTFPREAVVGRYGGEEFMGLLPGFDPEGAFDAADRFRAALEGQTWRERGLTVTISGGVAALRVDESADEVIHRADHALYRAKMAGRNRIERGDPVESGT